MWSKMAADCQDWLLQVDLPKLQAAISIACRLGFATRLPNPYEGE
jgi:hypothetical protein